MKTKNFQLKKTVITLAIVLAATAGAQAQSWNIGTPVATDVTATLSHTGGVLTVSGTGAIQDFAGATYVPWYSVKGSITKLVFQGAITHIGNYVFNSLDNLTGDVTIPNSVNSIGTSAFGNNGNLTSVTIPASVTNLGTYAFYFCSGLTSITSLNPTPSAITMGSGVFTNVNTTDCTLQVPPGSKTAYQAAAQWNSFTNIAEFLFEVGTPQSTQYATSLDDALALLPPDVLGGTIKLLANINYNGGIAIENSNYAFNLNGFKLNITNTAGIGVEAAKGSNISLVDPANGEFNVIGSEVGVKTSGFLSGVSNITVTSAKATDAAGQAVVADGGEIYVTGNATATGSSGIGVSALNGGRVQVDGKIIVPAGAAYISINGVPKAKAAGVVSTDMPGYLEYGDGDAIVWVKDDTSGVETITADALSIYPNPVKDELFIINNEQLTMNNVEIVDLTGKKILIPHSSFLIPINVSSLTQGIYFLKIETDKGIVTKKFVKE